MIENWTASTYAARAVLDYTSAFMIRTQMTLETGYWITVATYGLTSIAAAVLAILVMWRIGAAQAERYAANPWRERPTDFPAFTVDHLLADEPATAEPQPETGPTVRAPIPPLTPAT